MFSPSDQDILRALIAERGSAVIPTGGISDTISLSGGLPTSPNQTNFVAQTDNYKIDPRGNRIGDAALDAAGLYGDLSGQFYDGMGRPARQAKAGAGRMIGRGGRKMAGNLGAKLSAVPGMAKVGAAAKVLAPGLGALGGALAVGDLVLGDESAANKTMDAAAMAAGGFIGSIGGPLGTAAGVGLGKMASDGIQYLFGDKKTPEQRRMEEALAALGGGRI